MLKNWVSVSISAGAVTGASDARPLTRATGGYFVAAGVSDLAALNTRPRPLADPGLSRL